MRFLIVFDFSARVQEARSEARRGYAVSGAGSTRLRFYRNTL